MNYYERVQAAIDYIEEDLSVEVSIEALCKKSLMCRANLYRMFFTLTGFSVKEYIRLRRLSEASKLMQHDSILNAALSVGFNNHESFSRAFKQATQVPPKVYKRNELILQFERIDIMDKYFDIQDTDLIEKYPEIKVLKQLEPFRVAYFCYFGQQPEDGAFKEITQWAKDNHVDLNQTRLFGFNNPSPISDGEPYGYEVWVKLKDDQIVNHPNVKEKTVDGGLYAVTTVKHGPESIFPAWQRLNAWLLDSKYTTGHHQWLEEHHGFSNYEHIGDIDLFMPIQKRTEFNSNFVQQDDMLVISIKGHHQPVEIMNQLFEYAKENHLIQNKTRFFAYYDPNLIGKPNWWYEACMTVDKEVTVTAPLKSKTFKGGYYAVHETEYSFNGNSWAEFIQAIERNASLQFAQGYSFFEEYLLNNQPLSMSTKVKQYMPVRSI